MSAIDIAVRLHAPALRLLSLRSNFTWAVGGNAVYAICQWAMIVALAIFGSSVMVGQFSLGLAIVTPVLILSDLDLPAVQTTDAGHQYGFADYLRPRILHGVCDSIADASPDQRPAVALLRGCP